MEPVASPQKRPVLAIETSGREGGVALLLPDGRVIERALGHEKPGGRPSGHGRMLVPMIDEIVAEAGIAKRDIGAVAVSLGPGSYTGLRIGVTAAKTLCWALGCDLVGVSTLEALARDAAGGSPEGTRRLVPAMDARRGEVYAGLFLLAGGSVTRESEDRAIAPDELSRLLAPGDHVFGEAVAAYPRKLMLPEGATSAEGPASPRLATVARLGAEMLARGEVTPPHDAAPMYLRKSEAEIMKERATRGRVASGPSREDTRRG